MTDIQPAWTRHRDSDSNTSREAAEAITPKISDIQKHILQILGRHKRGLTDHEIDLMAGNEHSSTYRSRRAELTKIKLIEDSGERRKIKNRNCVIWRLAEISTAETPF